MSRSSRRPTMSANSSGVRSACPRVFFEVYVSPFRRDQPTGHERSRVQGFPPVGGEDVRSCPGMSFKMSRDAVALSWRVAHGAEAPQISAVSVLAPPRRRLTRDEVMNAGEVAQLLHLPVSTVDYLPAAGRSPRVGWSGRGGLCGRGSRSSWVPDAAHPHERGSLTMPAPPRGRGPRPFVHPNWPGQLAASCALNRRRLASGGAGRSVGRSAPNS